MDLLSIPVTLEGTQYSDSNRFTYMWEVNQKVVATTKDLNVYANFPLGINTARFVVTDKELGTKAFKNFRINVSSSTAGDGILVLSKYQGHAELSFKRLDREGSTFTPNYYEALTGNRLGTNPRKIHRCYIPEAANVNSGLKIETDHRLKCLSEETLVEIGENKYLDHNFFISRAMTLPPDITEFDVKACWHLTTSATTTSLGGYIFVIANDELWHDQRMAMPAYNVDLNMTFMQKASPWHGQLSPVMFLASLTGSGTQNYSSPELLYLFDESEGQFIYANVNSSAANRACSELGIYAGYSLLYGTHTASPNQAVAVLGNGSVYRMLYLKLPSKTSETAAVPFTVLADVIVPGEVINSGTSYYPMKNESYMFFATVSAAVALVIPLVIRYVTSTLIYMEPQAILGQIRWIALMLFALVAVDCYSRFFIANQGHVMGAKIEYDMRAEIFAHFQKLSFSFYDDQKVGQLMSRITTDLFDITELMHHGPENIILSLIKIIGAFVILMSIKPALALAAFAVLPFMFLFAYYMNGKMRRAFRSNRERIADINAQIRG